MSRLIKATRIEKLEYQKQKPVHPLWGWIKISGQRVPIEKLVSDADIRYEVCAPTGFRFVESRQHNLLCADYKDLVVSTGGQTLEPCLRPCDWCGAK